MKNEIITQVYYKIEEFMNHGIQYIVWYEVINFYTGCTTNIKAFVTRDKQEAKDMQDELFNRFLKEKEVKK